VRLSISSHGLRAGEGRGSRAWQSRLAVARTIAAAICAALLAGSAGAPAGAETFRIGFVASLTTPAKTLGEELRDGFLLGLDEIGRKAGGIDIEALFEDDAFSVETGLAATKKLIHQDKVDILTGHIWSNILIVASEYALETGKIFISANAGASLRAGKGCHPNFFNIAFENSQLPGAIGKFFAERLATKAYIIAPDYAAGRDMANGFKLAFAKSGGTVVGESLTRWTPQPDTDFAPHFAKARAAGAEVIFTFYPGRPGHEFLRQYKTSGLVGDIALATSFTVDALSLTSLEKHNVGGVWGMLTAVHWAANLPSDQNQRFVRTFKERYGREPTSYSAQSYDLVFLLKAALERTKGSFRDTRALAHALRTAQWPSTRGPVKFGRNQFLRQSLYLATVVAEEKGWALRTREVIEHDAIDPAANACAMHIQAAAK
jgi:branched-chain amino acid transport system substrate-binding protein